PVDACSAADRTPSALPFPSARGRGVSALTPLPLALGKGKALGVLSGAEHASTGTAASVEALTKRRPGFSTRRPGQGRKDSECKPLFRSPCRGSPPERLAPLTVEAGRIRNRSARLCLY